MSGRLWLVVAALGARCLLTYGGEADPDEALMAAGPAVPTAEGTDGGAIAGKISFLGAVPPPQKVRLSADPRCVAMHKNGLERRAIEVRDGGLADVLVYVKAGISNAYPAPADPVVLDQIGCEYHPRMVVTMVGQALRIRNSDDTLHNIHPRPTVNREFNVGQPRKGMETTKTLDKPELMIPTGCDVHPWMRAQISVLAHPFFAVTRENGTYEIKGLPEGEYEVEAIHSQLKSLLEKVFVKGGQTTKLDLSFKG